PAGDRTKPAAPLAILGVALTAALNRPRVVGWTLIGILAVTALGVPFGLAHYAGIVALPPSLASTLFQLDFSRAVELSFLTVVLPILMIDVFDNAGTLIGVTHRSGLMVDGRLPRMRQ